MGSNGIFLGVNWDNGITLGMVPLFWGHPPRGWKIFGFSSITESLQGPPGTGKTSTVLALLAVLLASRKAKAVARCV